MENILETNIDGFTIRYGTKDDAHTILSFIRKLAVYEDMLDMVVATEDSLTKSIFDKQGAKVLIGEYDGKPVGFALFFYNYSTFLGKRGLYLEDLFVDPVMRGKSMGKTLLKILAKIAKSEDCGRMEWSCLDWNEPSINFYKHIGAVPMEDWTTYRLDKQAIENFIQD